MQMEAAKVPRMWKRPGATRLSPTYRARARAPPLQSIQSPSLLPIPIHPSILPSRGLSLSLPSFPP